jgi:hypothetical protein
LGFLDGLGELRVGTGRSRGRRLGLRRSADGALVSDDPSIRDDEQRKDEVRERVRRAGGNALVVYAADKVSKVRELRILLATGRDRDAAAVKLRRYWKSLRMLEQAIPGNRLVELLRFELEALEALPLEESELQMRSERPSG